MTSLSAIHRQSLSTLVCDWFLCPSCGIIDRDHGRMLDDNRLTSQKLDRLFPSIVGLKWKQAIGILSEKHAKEYAEGSSLMEEAARERNKFLHEGSPWRISRDLSERCIDSLFEWMSLFANLHNEYTQPFWSVRVASSPSTG